jgi:hypothetical protein
MMNKLKRTTLFLAVSLTALLCVGCDYVPISTYEVETKTGEVITLACPVVYAGRSKLTYFTDADGCRIYK